MKFLCWLIGHKVTLEHGAVSCSRCCALIFGGAELQESIERAMTEARREQR